MGTVPRGRKEQAIVDGDWDWDEKRDLDAIVETLGWRGVADAHAWYDGGLRLPKRKNAYKLPHHLLRDEELVLSRRGYSARWPRSTALAAAQTCRTLTAAGCTTT